MIGEAILDYNAFYRVYEKVVAKREATTKVAPTFQGQTGRPQGSPLHFKMSHYFSVHSHVTQVPDRATTRVNTFQRGR